MLATILFFMGVGLMTAFPLTMTAQLFAAAAFGWAPPFKTVDRQANIAAVISIIGSVTTVAATFALTGLPQ